MTAPPPPPPPSSPYSCRLMLSVSAAFVSETPTVALGAVHILFILVVLGFIEAVRRHSKST